MTRRHWWWWLLLSLGLSWAGVGVSRGADALGVRVTQVNDADFPQVVADVVVTDATGWPVAGLTAAQFTIVEQQRALPAKAYTVEPSAAQNLRVVVALDVSVERNNWPAVQAAIHDFLGDLVPADEVALVTFADQAQVLQPFTTDKAKLQTLLAGLQPGGSFTSLHAGIMEALDLLAQGKAGGRPLVIVVSDSPDNANNTPADEVVLKALQAQVPVYLVGFGAKVNTASFKNLAAQTKAQALVLGTASEMTTPLRLLGVALRQGYRLTFTSTRVADDATHPFTVTVAQEAAIGLATGQLVARPGKIVVAGPGFDVTQPVLGRVFLLALVQSAAPIARVTYTLDDVLLGEVQTAPYGYDLDTSILAPGPHQLLIQAFDQAGNHGQQLVEFVVAVPPQLALTLTTPYTTTERGTVIVISAQPKTVHAIRQIDFWLDGVLAGQVTEAPFAHVLDTQQFAPGAHVLIAQAENVQGERATASLELQLTTPWWQSGLYYLMVGAGGVVWLVLVAATFVLPWQLVRRLHQRVVSVQTLEVENCGNVPSRYDVQLESDPPGLLKTEFWLGDKVLSQTQGRKAAPAPAKAAGRAATPRPTEKQPNPVLEGLGGMWSTVLDVLSSLGTLLGGPVSQLSRSASQVDRTASSAQRVGSDVARVQSKLQGAPSEARVSETPDEVANEPTPPPVEVTLPVVPLTGPWAQTPALTPGARVTLELRVRPTKSFRARAYLFQLRSRAVETPTLQPQTENGTLHIVGLPWWLQSLPWVLALGLGCVAFFWGWYWVTQLW